MKESSQTTQTTQTTQSSQATHNKSELCELSELLSEQRTHLPQDILKYVNKRLKPHLEQERLRNISHDFTLKEWDNKLKNR